LPKKELDGAALMTDYIKKVKEAWKLPKEFPTFCFSDSMIVLVTRDTSKVNQFITIKLQRFWHQRDLCSIVKKWSNRDDRQTDTHTNKHTHRHTHRHTDAKFFNALSCSET
jgi:hypothetical protein